MEGVFVIFRYRCRTGPDGLLDPWIIMWQFRQDRLKAKTAFVARAPV
jgi:hypothetical protein